jgi:CRISPR-associated protein Cmr5
MSQHTRSQKLAQAAFPRVQDRREALGKAFDEYASFAKKFPALIHTCGLAQAVAFALAKKESQYIDDLAGVLEKSGHPAITSGTILRDQTQSQELNGYLRLSRDALNAAGWLKRYVEAAGEED